MTDSMFDEAGGYYSAMVNGIEYAKFAPSSVWTRVSHEMSLMYGEDFTFKWVRTACDDPSCAKHGVAASLSQQNRREAYRNR